MIDEKVPGFVRWISTAAGNIAVISSVTSFKDTLGAWMARWGFGRMSYLVAPGLYAVGMPSPDDPVIVTANYKMTYDIMRSSLSGRNIWMVVLETHGINVWCAAGKGTFGTEELITRIRTVQLDKVVAHRNLILPILGAPGVAAYEVRKQTGFGIKYGTIRAEDLPEYLDNGMVSKPAMRELTFTMRERLVLIPVEIVMSAKPALVIMMIIASLTAMINGSWTLKHIFPPMIAYAGAVISGVVLVPLLLPYIPSKSFSLKGAIAGLIWAVLLYAISRNNLPWYVSALIFLCLPAVSAYYGLNFTGCTPYTSRSGVKKEIRYAMPIMAGSLLIGLILFIIGRYLL